MPNSTKPSKSSAASGKKSEPIMIHNYCCPIKVKIGQITLPQPR